MIARTDDVLPGPLEPFEGREVIGSQIKITNAGDGLSEALAVEPAAFPLGSKHYVVLEVDVAKVQMQGVKDTDSLIRVHTFKAMGATIVDAELVAELVDHQKDIIRMRKEEAAGIQRLTFAPEPDTSEHDDRVARLSKLKKAELVNLAAANAIEHPKSANIARLAELLAELPGIDQIIASYESVPVEGEASVTSISDRETATEPTDDEWEDEKL